MNEKPRWEDAPEWAQWLAMDEDGDWYWYEKEPEPGWKSWAPRKGKTTVAGETDWEKTLEQRP